MSDLPKEISEISGVETEVVRRVLETLANMAYERAKEGFLIPSLGVFRLARGAEKKTINPFNGEEVIFYGPPEVEFAATVEAKEKFLGKIKDSAAELEEKPRTSDPLPELRLEPNTNDAEQIGLSAESTARAKNKLGGVPDWIQYPETPICCGVEMRFYGQFDSMIGGEFNLVDAGTIYVFFCENCYSTKSVLQFY